MSKRNRLRSQAMVLGLQDRDGFIHRTWMKNQGLPHDLFDGRPVIGICNTWSELTPCNVHFRDLAEQVKRGVCEAGGFPLEFPVMSLGETLMRPTTMLFRNLASDGCRGVDPRQPDRRRRAALRLRQDHALALMGAASVRPAGDRGLGRADAQRACSGQRHRLGHRRVAHVARRCAPGKMSRTIRRGRGLHAPLPRATA